MAILSLERLTDGGYAEHRLGENCMDLWYGYPP